MKLVHLRREPFDSRGIFQQVLETSQSPLTISAIRARARVLDALDDADADLILEDAEHDTLVAAINSFPWSTAKREVLEIIDDALGAKSPDEAAKE